MITFRTFIVRDGRDEIDVEVAFKYHRASRGARDSLCGVLGAGPQLEPDEPLDVDIKSVTIVETGKDLELSEDELARIEDECIEFVSEQQNRD